MSETEEKNVNMPRREFVALGGTSIAAAALGGPDPLSATDKVQTIEQQERETVALTFDIFGTVLDLAGSLTPPLKELLEECGASETIHAGDVWGHWRQRQRIEPRQ